MLVANPSNSWVLDHDALAYVFLGSTFVPAGLPAFLNAQQITTAIAGWYPIIIFKQHIRIETPASCPTSRNQGVIAKRSATDKTGMVSPFNTADFAFA